MGLPKQKDLNYMLQEASTLKEARLTLAQKIVDQFGPAKLSVECNGAMTELDALAFTALLGAWANNQNVIRTVVMTAYAMGKEVGALSVSQPTNNSSTQQRETGIPRVRENE